MPRYPQKQKDSIDSIIREEGSIRSTQILIEGFELEDLRLENAPIVLLQQLNQLIAKATPLVDEANKRYQTLLNTHRLHSQDLPNNLRLLERLNTQKKAVAELIASNMINNPKRYKTTTKKMLGNLESILNAVKEHEITMTALGVLSQQNGQKVCSKLRLLNNDGKPPQRRLEKPTASSTQIARNNSSETKMLSEHKDTADTLESSTAAKLTLLMLLLQKNAREKTAKERSITPNTPHHLQEDKLHRLNTDTDSEKNDHITQTDFSTDATTTETNALLADDSQSTTPITPNPTTELKKLSDNARLKNAYSTWAAFLMQRKNLRAEKVLTSAEEKTREATYQEEMKFREKITKSLETARIASTQGRSYFDDYAQGEQKKSVAQHTKTKREVFRASHDESTSRTESSKTRTNKDFLEYREDAFFDLDYKETSESSAHDETKSKPKKIESATAFFFTEKKSQTESTEIKVVREAKPFDTQKKSREVLWRVEGKTNRTLAEQYDDIAQQSFSFRVAEDFMLGEEIKSAPDEKRLLELKELKKNSKPGEITIVIPDQLERYRRNYRTDDFNDLPNVIIPSSTVRLSPMEFLALKAHLKYFDKVWCNGVVFSTKKPYDFFSKDEPSVAIEQDLNAILNID